jgi:hypothetical protein
MVLDNGSLQLIVFEGSKSRGTEWICHRLEQNHLGTTVEAEIAAGLLTYDKCRILDR